MLNETRVGRSAAFCTLVALAMLSACRDGARFDGVIDAEVDTWEVDATPVCDADALTEVSSRPDADVCACDAEVARRDADGEGCTYPGGPYELCAGSTFPAMAWPSAVVGVDETRSADLEQIRCEPGVHGIFIQAVSSNCSECPARLKQIGDLADHWRSYGVKWVFIVDNVFSGSTAASDYIDRYGISFGFRTNDADNSFGRCAIASSTLYRSVPWTGVIRASDMVLSYDEPDDEYLDIVNIAVELADGE